MPARLKKYVERFAMPKGIVSVPVRAKNALEAREKAIDRLCIRGELGKRWQCPFCGSREFIVERVVEKTVWDPLTLEAAFCKDGLYFGCMNLSCGQGALWSMPRPGSEEKGHVLLLSLAPWAYDPPAHFGPESWQRQFKP